MKKNQPVAIIAGARPNFMKVAPLIHELKKSNINFYLVNTGQHFDKKMSGDFFKELDIRSNYNLKPDQKSADKQLTDMMSGLEKVFEKEKPSLVVVVGDVNSTLAGALVAKKLNLQLVHIEAGLRSFNLEMPEESNRIIVDKLSDILFATQTEGVKHLKKEKVKGRVHMVGNIMMDTLSLFVNKVKKIPKDSEYYFCTLHRAENVDNKKVFTEILSALEEISNDSPIYLPLHPRTKKMANKFKLLNKLKKVCKILPPLNYSDTISYQKFAKLILTDSGGVQEEASFLGVPCLTLRTETERPITVSKGTNTIAGVTKKSILSAYKKKKLKNKHTNIPLWDGKASKRIVSVIKKNI